MPREKRQLEREVYEGGREQLPPAESPVSSEPVEAPATPEVEEISLPPIPREAEAEGSFHPPTLGSQLTEAGLARAKEVLLDSKSKPEEIEAAIEDIHRLQAKENQKTG